MTIRVLYFGVLREICTADFATVEAVGGATIQDILHQISEKFPELAKFSGCLAVAVNQQYASREQRLNDGDEVALLPPVSGGSFR